jgi:hypothetical protein
MSSNSNDKGHPEKTVVSAVITSQKRKIRLEFPDNRASTANTAILSGHSNNVRPQKPSGDSTVPVDSSLRPATHEGLVPAPPAGVPKRSQRAISTRQISFTIAEGETHQQMVSHPSPVEGKSGLAPILDDSVSTRPTTAFPSLSEHRDSLDSSIESNKRQKTGWNRINPDLLVPTFMKPSVPDHRPQTSSGFPVPQAQYASLSHRLRANISITPYPQQQQQQQQSRQQQQHQPSPTRGAQHYPFLPTGKKAVRLDASSVATSTTENSITSRQQQSLIPRKNYTNRRLEDVSRASSLDFMSMEFDDVLTYLIESHNAHPERNNAQEFIHVAPKHYVNHAYRYNLYDIVALDKPGNPKSGYVWTRDPAKYSSFHHSTLPKDHIMQFSLNGLLMTNAQTKEENDVIPLKQFLVEKEQVEFLHTGRFFGLFKELKAFTGWKNFTLHSFVSKMKKQLLTHTFFSDTELISAILTINNITYEIVNDIELFYFHGKGIICITDFILKQCHNLELVQMQLKKKIYVVIDNVVEQFNNFMNSSKLESLIQEVKDHHPMKDVIREDAQNHQDIDWIRLRSMQRISENFKQKMRNILFMAQFRIEYCLACLLEKFWLRLKLFIYGIKTLPSPVQENKKEPTTVATPSFQGGRRKYDHRSEAKSKPTTTTTSTATTAASMQKEKEKQNPLYALKMSGWYWDLDVALFDADGNLMINPNRLYWLNDLGVHKEKEKEQQEKTATDLTTAKPADGVTESKGGGDSSEEKEKVQQPHYHSYHGPQSFLPFQDEKDMFVPKHINQPWETTGTHLCINVNLYLNNRNVEPTDFVNLSNLDSLRVKINPTKQELMNQIHLLCGSLGKLVEFLPNLKYHPLVTQKINIYDSTTNASSGVISTEDIPSTKILDHDVDLGLGELFSQQSSNYFTLLVNYPTLNSRNGYQLAVSTMKLMNAAYLDASALESYLFKLTEIVKKLWSLSPITLVKQLERSLILPKLREYLENPDEVEDLKRSQQRDQGRLATYKTANEYLLRLPTILSTIYNIKHFTGFVSSFYPAIEQLKVYRIVQDYWLHLKLPNAYSLRSTLFYEFIRRIEQTFDLSGNITSSEVVNTLHFKISLLKKLKNFDNIKEHFDIEVEICDTLYHLINSHLVKKSKENEDNTLSLADLAIINLLNSKIKYSSTSRTSISSEKMYNIFRDAIDRMSVLISQGRAFLLMQLQFIRNELFTSKAQLHIKITERNEILQSFSITSKEKSFRVIDDFIYDNKNIINSLRKTANEFILGQQILLEAHDIVGAANAVMIDNELDLFADMDKLENFYDLRCKSWNIIQDCVSLNKSVNNTKLSSHQNNSQVIVDICSKYLIVSKLFHSDVKYKFNFEDSNDGEIINKIETELRDLLPRIELVACLSFKNMKPRHWLQLHHTAFQLCGLELKFTGRQSEFISVVDLANGKDSVIALGNINRIPASELISRGVDKFIAKIKNISADAVIEAILENTLETVDETLRQSTIQVSNSWLKDSRLRSKLFVELNEIINVVPLRVMVRYCWKAIMVTEATCSDMYVSTFDIRMEKTKEVLLKIDKFLENYHEIQFLWFYLFHFIKFTLRNEIDRDSVRVFNIATDEMKKVEMTLVQKNGNLFQAFNSPSMEHELFTDNLKASLHTIMEDIHNGIQSLLDACPRLSLLSYNKLVEFYRVWLLGPHGYLPFVTQCLSEVFEGVGEIKVVTHLMNAHSSHQGMGLLGANKDKEGGGAGSPGLQGIHLCQGFWSSSKLEFISFSEPVDFALSLDEFVKEFEKQLRKSMEKTCDVLILHRLNCVKALLSDNLIDAILENLETLFVIRNDQLRSLLSDDHCNHTYLLINLISFAEDIWTCLGHPTGCLTTARPDVFLQNTKFAHLWKQSLEKFATVAKDNIRHLQQYFIEPILFEKTHVGGTQKKGGSGPSGNKNAILHHNINNPLNYKTKFPSNLNRRKGKSIISSFILQEINFLHIAEELLSCSCIESAVELWASKYQLKYQYDKNQRYYFCPLEVMVGNILIPYGFEYQEGGTVFLQSKEMESAISRVLSSSFSCHGTTFINTPDFSALIKNSGEYSVTGKDIALALGRICTTLNHSTSNVSNVKFFLSRLIYLDAVGCIDFTSLDHYNLQILIQTIQAFWSAIENNADQFICDSLKYPMKGRYVRNDLHGERRKQNISNLRNSINLRKKANIFISFILIGFASEVEFTSLKVFDQFYRSIFDSVTIHSSRIIEYLGSMLTSKGFLYGIEIQKSLYLSIVTILQRVHQITSNPTLNYGAQDGTWTNSSGMVGTGIPLSTKLLNVLKLIFTNTEIYHLIDIATVSVELSTSSIYNIYSADSNKIGRFKNEMICFLSNLWDRFVWHCNGDFSVLTELKTFFMDPFVSNLENIANLEEVNKIRSIILENNNVLSIKDTCNYLLIQTARENGFICSNSFIQKCAFIWETVLTHNVFVLVGENSTGKSSIRETVKKTILKASVISKANEKDKTGVTDMENTDILSSLTWPVLLRHSARKILRVLVLWKQRVAEFRLAEMEAEKLRQQQQLSLLSSSRNHPMATTTTAKSTTTTNNAANGGSNNPNNSNLSNTVEIPSYLIGEATQNHDQYDLTTVIYHASMKTDSLLGCFDSNGKWQDGIILRKLRYLNYLLSTQNNRNSKEANSNVRGGGGTSSSAPVVADDNKPMNNLSMLVLNGPLTHQIEQLFHCIFFQSLSGMYSSLQAHNSNFSSERFILPTAEYITIPKGLKIIVETSDVRHTSPTCLALIAFRNIDFSLNECYSRILTAWYRSVGNWLGEYAPWLDFLDELNHLFFKTKFIEELLYYDLNYIDQRNSDNANATSKGAAGRHNESDEEFTSASSTSLILSKMSSFFRILEELLLQIHELSLKHAHFTQPEREDFSSSDDEALFKTEDKKKDDSSVSKAGAENDHSDDDESKATGEKKKADHLKEGSVHSSTAGPPPALLDKLASFQNNKNAQMNFGLMSLGPKYRTLLLTRARLALIYSATWGFGGSLNNTDKRKFFENMLRESISQYFTEDLDISNDCSLFDCVFDLEHGAIKQAVQWDLLNKKIIQNKALNEKFFDQQIYCEYLINESFNSTNRPDTAENHFNGVSNGQLRFHSMGTRAVTSTMQLLLTAGANVLLFGNKGCGKTTLISDLLIKLKKNCPNSEDMRRQVSDNLVNIINGIGEPEGIFRTLNILNKILLDSSLLATNDKTSNNFNRCWRKLGDRLLQMASDNPRTHVNNATVSSSSTSLIGLDGAGDLRKWFEREFATETKHVLETSRFTYGIAFIDDFNMISPTEISNTGEESMRNRLNREDQLLKGLLDSSPLFGVERNTVTRNPNYNGIMTRNKNYNFFPNHSHAPPVLHQENNSDIRIQLFQNDNHMLQKLSFLSAYTGNINAYYKSNRLRSLISHYAVLSLPNFTMNELHVSLISGSLVSMGLNMNDFSVIDMLKNEIAELSKVTLQICNRFISSIDFSLTTLLEKAARSMILLDISNIGRFCLSLRFGALHVHNPGGLLQLYCHEWKRFFIDPLPDGTQRDRIINLFAEQLDCMDEKTWSVTREWFQSIKDDLSNPVDRVWTNALVFKQNVMNPLIRQSQQFHSPMDSRPASSQRPASGNYLKRFKTDLSSSELQETQQMEDGIKNDDETDSVNNDIPDGNEKNNKEMYLPIEFDLAGTKKALLSGAFNVKTKSYERVSTPEKTSMNGKVDRTLSLYSCLNRNEVHSLLYPLAFSYILRIIRIISNAGKHILLAGYSSLSRKNSLILAAKLCSLQPYLFTTREINGILEMLPSELANYFMNFKRFLKECILKSIGLIDKNADKFYEHEEMNHPVVGTAAAAAATAFSFLRHEYTVIPEQKVLIIIDNAQQLLDGDRRLLLQIMDSCDPTIVFDNTEIQQISDILRKLQKDDDFQKMADLELKSQLEYDLLKSQQEGKAAYIPRPISSPNHSANSPKSRTHSMFDEEESKVTTGDENRSTAGNNEGENDKNGQEKARTLMITATKGDLTGYTFHWLKRRFEKAIKENVRFALNVTIPRTTELDSRLFVSNDEALASIRKSSGITQQLNKRSGPTTMNNAFNPFAAINRSQQQQQQLFSGLSAPEEKAATDSSTIGGSGGSKNQNRMSTKRYSLLSDRSVTSTNNISQRITGAAANIDANIESYLDRSNSASRSSQPIGSHSLFTCPILGPILTRCFNILWMEIDHNEAVNGICTRLMKNEAERRIINPWNSTPQFRNNPFDTPRAHSNALLPSSVMLSIKSTEIGKYHYIETNRQRTGGNAKEGENPESAPPPQKMQIARRMSALEMAAKNYEVSRHQRFKEYSKQLQSARSIGKTFQSYNVLLESSNTLYHEIHSFSWLQYFGILKSFKFPLDLLDFDSRDTQNILDAVELKFSYFVEEASVLLPHLLTLPLPSDALFFSIPVYVQGSDIIAIRASETVMYILRTFLKDMLLLQFTIEKVLKQYDEALYALENADSMDKKLLENNEELLTVSRQISKEIELTRKEHTLVDATFTSSVEYELELMMGEDLKSCRLRKEGIDSQVELIFSSLKQTIKAFAQSEWQSLTAFYTTKPYHKPMIEIMRAIMVVINFVPPKSKGDKHHHHSGSKMDDDMVARYTVALIVKSRDLVNQICNVNPTTLTQPQLNALRIMNNLLNNNFSFYLKAEQYGKPYQRLVLYQQCLSAPIENNDIFEALRKYLLMIDLVSISHEYFTQEKNETIEPLIIETKKLREVNIENKVQKKNSLKVAIDLLINKIHFLDNLLNNNKRKLETIEKAKNRKMEISLALNEVRTIMKCEFEKISNNLSTFVTDLSIWVTICFRCGYLPDHLRQHCCDTLKQNLISSYNLKTTDSPFLAGCLLDRLQIRQWVNFHETNSIPNDLPSINSMSLLYLSPYYTYLIDPDGSSQHAIKAALPGTYQCFTITSQKFSLGVFITLLQNFKKQEEQQLAKAQENNNMKHDDDDDGEDVDDNDKSQKQHVSENGMCLIINDIHCGVTEDLVCLLSSHIDYEYRPAEEDAWDPHGIFTYLSLDSLNSSKQTVNGFDFGEELFYSLDAEEKKGNDPISATKSSPGKAATTQRNRDVLNTGNLFTSSTHIPIPKKFRLILISATPPTLDSRGNSSPLPICCFEKMTILHWSISYLSKFQVDSMTAENALEKNALSDHSFSHYLGMKMLKTLHPKFVPHVSEMNKSILIDLLKVGGIDNQLFYQVYKWNQTENASNASNANTSNTVTNNIPQSINRVSSTDVAVADAVNRVMGATNPVNPRASTFNSSIIAAAAGGSGNSRLSIAAAQVAASGLEGLIELVPVSLSILSDQKILNLVLSIQHHRQELLQSLVSKKLLIRERNAYFHIFQEVLSMSYDYIKFCANFLPNECFSPYALTIQAMRMNLIPSLMKYGMKSSIILLKNIPISTLYLLKIWNSIVFLQHCFRAHRRRKMQAHLVQKEHSSSNLYNNPASPHGGSGQEKPRFFLNVATSLINIELAALSNEKMTVNPSGAGTGPKDPSTPGRKSQRHDPVVDFNHFTQQSRLVGLIPSLRNKATNILNYLLIPLRSFFLKGFTRYVQLNIRPGYENITKLLLLLTSWSQQDKLPMEELRSYFYVFLENKGYQLQRFSFFLPVNPLVYGGGKGNKENTNNNVTALNKDLLSAVHNSRERGGGGVGPNGRRHSTFAVDENEEMGSNLALSPPKKNEGTLTFDKEGFSPLSSPNAASQDHELLESLPGMKKMHHRVTAFRMHTEDEENKFSSGKKAQQSSSSSSSFAYREWNYEDLLERGYGLPDCLWINTRSNHWVMTSTLSNNNSYYSHSSSVKSYFKSYLLGDNLYYDEFSTVKPKTMLRIPMKYDDVFEIEWLKVKGIKTFSTMNAKALVALGATNKIIDDINQARQTLFVKPEKQNSNRKTARQRLASQREANSSHRKTLRLGRQSRKESGAAASTKSEGPAASGPSSVRQSLIVRKTMLHSSLTKNQQPTGKERGSNNAPVVSATRNNRIITSNKLTSRASNLLEEMTSDLSLKRRSSVASTTSSTIQRLSQRTSTRMSQIAEGLKHNATNDNGPDSQGNNKSSRMSVFSPAPSSNRFSSSSSLSSPAGKKPPISSVGITVRDFIEILYDEKAFMNLYLLENHPNLAPVYRGITAGISRNINDFLDWKESLLYLQSIDMSSLNDQEIISLIQSVQPPKCYDIDDVDNSNTGQDDDGLWSLGYELTIIQSLLLSESLWPGSSHILMNFHFALIQSFLQKDGYIILHPDEITFDEDDDFEDNFFDGGEDDEEADTADATRSNSYSSQSSYNSVGGGGSSNVGATAGGNKSKVSLKLGLGKLQEEDEEEEDEEGGGEHAEEGEGNSVETKEEEEKAMNIVDLTKSNVKEITKKNKSNNSMIISPSSLLKISYSNVSTEENTMTSRNKKGSTSSGQQNTRSTFFKSLQQYSTTIQALKQLNIPMINSWYKLEKIITQRVILKGPEIIINKTNEQFSMSLLTHRDFFPWECIIYEVINEYYDVEKFVFMKELRDTIIGNKSTYFLIPHFHGSQSAIFSQRARDYALLANKHIPILFCHFNDHLLMEEPPQSTSLDNKEIATSIYDNSIVLDHIDKRQYRSILNELIKTIKISIQSTNARKAILEVLDLTSIFGNSLLYSILIQMPTTQLNQSAGGGSGGNQGLSEITAFLFQSNTSSAAATAAIAAPAGDLSSAATEKPPQLQSVGKKESLKLLTNTADTTNIVPSFSETNEASMKDNTRLMNKFMKGAALPPVALPSSNFVSSSRGDFNALKEYNALFKYEDEAKQVKIKGKKTVSEHEKKRNWRDSFPLIISSEWNDSNTKTHNNHYILPPYVLSEISYAWLPRFFAPDVIKLYRQIDLEYNHLRAANTNSFHNTRSLSNPFGGGSGSGGGGMNDYEKYIYENLLMLSMSKENPSLPESCGILFEEMESSLLSVMNSTHSIIHTRLTPDIRMKLRNMKKLEMRVTACVFTLWQLINYLQCNLLEQYYSNLSYQNNSKGTGGSSGGGSQTGGGGISGLVSSSDFLKDYLSTAISTVSWSKCLNSLNLWQLSRLMIKITDILAFPWKTILHSNNVTKLRQSILLMNTPTGLMGVNKTQLEKDKEMDHSSLVNELLNTELYQEGILSLLDSFSNLNYSFYHSNILKENYLKQSTPGLVKDPLFNQKKKMQSKLEQFNLFHMIRGGAAAAGMNDPQPAPPKERKEDETKESKKKATTAGGGPPPVEINQNNAHNLRRASALFMPKNVQTRIQKESLTNLFSLSASSPIATGVPKQQTILSPQQQSPARPPPQQPLPPTSTNSNNPKTHSGFTNPNSVRAQKQAKRQLKKVEEFRQNYLDSLLTVDNFSSAEQLPTVHEILKDQFLSYLSINNQNSGTNKEQSNSEAASIQSAQENLNTKFYTRFSQIISYYLAEVIIHQVSLAEVAEELTKQQQQKPTSAGRSGRPLKREPSTKRGINPVIHPSALTAKAPSSASLKVSTTEQSKGGGEAVVVETVEGGGSDSDNEDDYMTEEQEFERSERTAQSLRKLSVAVKDLRDQFHSHHQFENSHFAEVKSRSNSSKPLLAKKNSNQALLNQESSSKMLSHRESNKLNITSVLTNFQARLQERQQQQKQQKPEQSSKGVSIHDPKGPQQPTSAMPDIMFGSLLPEDMMKCMLKWTFDGNQVQEIQQRRQTMRYLLQKRNSEVQQNKIVGFNVDENNNKNKNDGLIDVFIPKYINTKRIDRKKVLRMFIVYARKVRNGEIKYYEDDS